MTLDGKAALVTGSSRGIGRGIAERLAADGADVVVNYVSDAAGAAETVRLVEAAGRRALTVQADISRPDDVDRLFAEAARAFGGLDVVVANAALELVQVPFTDYTEAQFDDVFATNAKGTFLTLQRAATALRSPGRIIVVSSNSVDHAHQGFAVYGASKAVGRFLVEVLAKELGDRQITVNSVVPGVTRGAGVFTATPADDPFYDLIAERTPLGRVGTAADVAAAVSFLAGAESAFVTGHHLQVDGGIAL